MTGERLTRAEWDEIGDLIREGGEIPTDLRVEYFFDERGAGTMRITRPIHHQPTYGTGICPRCGTVMATAGPGHWVGSTPANCIPTPVWRAERKDGE